MIDVKKPIWNRCLMHTKDSTFLPQICRMRILTCLCSKSTQATSNLFQRIVRHFPDEGNLSLAFTYGSGVFPQHGHADMAANMIDFIFVVRDSKKFHEKNLQINMAHYSALMRKLGSSRAAHLQENYGACVFYNTLINCEGRLIKYGVISNASLQSDLLNWDSLYIAGRLHKPVNVVHHYFEDNPELMLAMRQNLLSAIFTSFLLLPETFSEMQLYHQVAGLSYLGDFRMTFGEDKGKIRNIVEPNYHHFRDLYRPILKNVASDMQDFVSWQPESQKLQVDSSPKARHIYLEKLPLRLQIRMAREFDKSAMQIRDLEEILRSIARFGNIEDPVRDAVIHTVKKSAWNQSILSLVSVGLVKGWRYSLQKIRKMSKGIVRSWRT